MLFCFYFSFFAPATLTLDVKNCFVQAKANAISMVGRGKQNTMIIALWSL
jgi:hypothetical protein